MNSEIRDHLNWTKGFADLITNSTAGDTGAATYLRISRATAGDTVTVLEGQVTGDTVPRIRIGSNGTIGWGTGAAAADATIARESSVRLKMTGPAFVVERATENATFMSRYTGDAADRWYVTNSGTMRWGDGTGAVDTGLDRYAAGVLRLPSSPDTSIVKHGTAVDSQFLRSALPADSTYRFYQDTEGHMYWANGTATYDVHMQRQATGRLYVDGILQTSQGVGIKVYSGAISDGIFGAYTVISGLMALDSTNSRLYVRVGTTWKYAALV